MLQLTESKSVRQDLVNNNNYVKKEQDLLGGISRQVETAVRNLTRKEHLHRTEKKKKRRD